LYAAAIVMFEMLTGTTPFDSPDRTELAVRAAQLDEAPPPITRVVPGSPPALDIVFARALAKHRDLRYDSARALGEAFRTALGIPDSPGWKAQAELSRVAKTLSMAMPQLADLEPTPALPETADEPPGLPRTLSEPPASPAVAAAVAEADRYATDVMTAFKKGQG
jgi:serine/threonine-protein kinase